MACRLLILLAVSLFAHRALAAEPGLRVGVPIDVPPYVMEKATEGLEVDILFRALAGYTLHFTQLSYGELQTAVREGRVDVASSVQYRDDGVFYSCDFLTFANYAISKKADALKIGRVADLKDHQVLTWQNAYLELGDEFESLFSPGSPQRKGYIELADQREQVRMFWQGTGHIVVIDRSIFNYLSKEMGHSMTEVDLHSLFPAVTNFKVSFKEAAMRDAFDQGLTKLCQSGAYAELLDRYEVVLQTTVCDSSVPTTRVLAASTSSSACDRAAQGSPKVPVASFPVRARNGVENLRSRRDHETLPI